MTLRFPFHSIFFAVASQSTADVISTWVVTIAGIGIVVTFLYFIFAYAKSQWGGNVAPVVSGGEQTGAAMPAEVRQKIQKIVSGSRGAEGAVEAISQVIEEQTRERVREVEQDYAIKYQVLVKEKNREVETVKKDVQVVQEKFEKTEKAYKKVEVEKKTTEAVMRSISEGLVVVNQKGEVLMMNPSAERLLGVNSQQKTGKSILEGTGEEHVVSLMRQKEGSAEKTIEVSGKDENAKRVIRSSSAVIQNEDGQTVGMVNILTDVTKQKELEQLKNQFISNVTHELRTPIVAMQKAMTILQSQSAGPLNTDQSNFVGIVGRNLTHLSHLVEDLLDIARMDSGKMKIVFKPGRIEKICHDVCFQLDTWAKSKNIKMVLEEAGTFPELVLDEAKISQVLVNLVGNAIKFTPNGGQITVRPLFRNDGMVQVGVQDTGVGIAKENLPKLFKRFAQFGDQQGISGTGLGLAISKEIVESHGGKIFADSVEGKGATFTFTLPLKPPAAKPDTPSGG